MSQDIALINAAFDALKTLELLYGDEIPASALRKGFEFQGEEIRLENQVVGIFKPRQMERGVLSIKTTKPRDGSSSVFGYSDTRRDDGYYYYSLQRGDPRGSNNRRLWESLEEKQPFVYFHAVAPAIYAAIWPCYVSEIDPDAGHALVSIGARNYRNPVSYPRSFPSEFESKYLVKESKTRLHQSSFRLAVLDAYRHRCAITGLQAPKLLEAAHIIPDGEVGDIQFLSNGVALSRIHHRAYDSNLLGIAPDCTIHIGKELQAVSDNEFCQSAFLKYEGAKLSVPRNVDAHPNSEFLAKRFEQFEFSNL